MSDRLEAVILARDQASKVFEKVGDSAEKMGDDITASAKESGRSLKELQDDAKNVALGVGVMIGSFALAGQSARDHEIAVNALRRGYGDAADDMLAFTERLQDTTNYSNDAAVAAANIARTLALNYGFTADEIQRVLTISADLAAATGYSLEDATMRVVSALRGEAESAEMLGLTLNQAAIDSDNLTLSMSNQEAAHFRLNALIEQSSFAQGAAAEQAETTYGRLQDLSHGFQDMAISVAESTGPLGEAGAFLADNALQAAAAGLAIGQMAGAATSLVRLTGAFGPVGIAAGLAVGGIYLLSDALKRDLPEASEEAVESIETLEEAILRLDERGKLTGSRLEMAESIVEIGEAVRTGNEFLNTSTEDLGVALEMMLKAMGDTKTGLGETIDVQDEYLTQVLGLTEAQIALINTNGDEVISLEEVTAAYESRTGAIEQAQAVNEALIATSDEAQYILNAEGEAAAYAQLGYSNLTDALLDGTITKEQYIAAVEQLEAGLRSESLAASLAADSIEEVNKTTANSSPPWWFLTTETEAALRDYEGLGDEVLGFWSSWIGDVTDGRAVDGLNKLAEASRNALAAFTGVEGDYSNMPWAVDALGSVFELGAAGQSAFAGLGEGMAERLHEQFSTVFEAMRSEFTSAGDTLGSVFQTVVGSTDAIAKQSDEVANWATELIAVEGTYSALDDLLKANRITLEQYNDAQQAHNSIISDNALIQEHVLTLQAQHAPAIADAESRLQDYLATLTEASAEEQTYALAMMDTATSARALELAQAAIGNMDVFGPMLVAAANLDPYLASILEELGLIEEVDGQIVLTADAEGAKTEVGLLTEAISQLTREMWILRFGGDISAAEDAYNEAYGKAEDWDGSESTASIDADNTSATSSFDTAQTYFDNWNGSTATATIDVIDNASPTMNSVIQMLYGIDGYTASAQITTYYTNIGQPGYQEMHGGVMGYADGGVVARMGETMPELMTLPNGAKRLALTDGLYGVPQGTYVTPGPATAGMTGNLGGTTVHVHIANLYGDETLAEKVSREIVPAIQRAMAVHERGF